MGQHHQRKGVLQSSGAKGRRKGLGGSRTVAMEVLLSQAEQLPSPLEAYHSVLVQGWDAATLQRALDWGRFFQQLHSRPLCQPGLRTASGRRLCRGHQLSLGPLRHCPQLLGLALLENRVLPSAAYQHLLRSLLFPGGHDKGSFIPLLTRRKAASQLLCLHLAPPEASAGHWVTPQLRAQAQLLLLQLREEEEGGGEGCTPSSLFLLDQLPRGLVLYRVVAVALLEPAGEAKARAPLLLWLLQGDPARHSAFCRLLPAPGMASLCSRYPELRAHYFGLLAVWGSRLSYDPLRGEWKISGLEEDEVPWQEMRERVGCLLQEPEPLRSTIRTQLSRLKTEDGDFEIRGLNVWTDLLLDMETTALEKMLVPNLL